MNAVITACILMMGAVVASCSKDDSPDNNVVVAQGDPVSVTVTINQTSSGNSRASTSMETATPAETGITDENLVIFVFDAVSGMLESTHAVAIDGTVAATATATATSKSFSVTTGDKYFYIFANANTALNDIKDTYVSGEAFLRSLAPANSTHANFKTQVLKKLSVPALSQNSKFLIGTLWAADPANKKTIDAPASSSAPAVNISGLNVGRLVSKVSFPTTNTFDFQFNTASTLGGNWSDVAWRIVNQPSEMFVIGNWENSLPGNSGSQVKTPFFYDPASPAEPELFWDIDPNNAGKAIAVDGSQTAWGSGAELYTLENTHDYPRKGNTTAVQFRGKFTPTTVISAGGIPETVTGTFWSSNVTDLTGAVAVRYYNTKPTDYLNSQKSSLTISDFTPPVRYKGGEVFYHAYITDSNEPKENEGNKRYAVLRNHQYSLDIKSISGLGDNDDNPFNKPGGDPDSPEPGGTDDPKPTDPIDKDIPNITISIKVMDWYLINQSINW